MIKDKKFAWVLEQEMDWLKHVVDFTIQHFFKNDNEPWSNLAIPELAGSYATLAETWNLNFEQRLAIALPMAIYIRPQLLNAFLLTNNETGKLYTEFGGVTDQQRNLFLPTGQTLYFLATAINPESKSIVIDLIEKDSILIKEQVIKLEKTASHLPRMCSILKLNADWLLYFITGDLVKPLKTLAFGAKIITTSLNWDNMVWSQHIAQQLLEIKIWKDHNLTITDKKPVFTNLKAGYKVAFYGPAGTGKTTTAALLGKTFGVDVCAVNLSAVMYLGVSESISNLSAIFDESAQASSILLIENGDLISEKPAHSHPLADQQKAAILHLIADYPGLLIVSATKAFDTNQWFDSHFELPVHFTMPTAAEAKVIWQESLAGNKLHESVDLNRLANDYELSGGSILKVVRYCMLTAQSKNNASITMPELLSAIAIALKRSGKNRTIKNQ